METKTRIFEVREEVERVETSKSERLIFENREGRWVYHAPNAQDHTEEQLEIILKKLKELNHTG